MQCRCMLDPVKSLWSYIFAGSWYKHTSLYLSFKLVYIRILDWDILRGLNFGTRRHMMSVFRIQQCRDRSYAGLPRAVSSTRVH